jgi:hypothetical protein
MPQMMEQRRWRRWQTQMEWKMNCREWMVDFTFAKKSMLWVLHGAGATAVGAKKFSTEQK